MNIISSQQWTAELTIYCQNRNCNAYHVKSVCHSCNGLTLQSFPYACKNPTKCIRTQQQKIWKFSNCNTEKFFNWLRQCIADGSWWIKNHKGEPRSITAYAMIDFRAKVWTRVLQSLFHFAIKFPPNMLEPIIISTMMKKIPKDEGVKFITNACT